MLLLSQLPVLPPAAICKILHNVAALSSPERNYIAMKTQKGQLIDHVTLLGASCVVRATWQEIQRFVWKIKANKLFMTPLSRLSPS